MKKSQGNSPFACTRHQMFEAINGVASLEEMQVVTAIPGSKKMGGLRSPFFRRFRTN